MAKQIGGSLRNVQGLFDERWENKLCETVFALSDQDIGDDLTVQPRPDDAIHALADCRCVRSRGVRLDCCGCALAKRVAGVVSSLRWPPLYGQTRSSDRKS